MRILLLGNYGQLGWELRRALAPLGPVIAFDYPEIDLSKPESVRSKIRATNPEVIVNATAYTAVDQAEKEPEIAMAINGHTPKVLAKEAADLGALLIHYSTDYVFDGAKGEPYIEEDQPNPVNVYGHTKLVGEQAIQEVGDAFLILRTSWVYSLRRDSFVTKVLRWARTQDTLNIVADQIGNPTWCRMLAEITAQLLAGGRQNVIAWVRKRRGLYHLAGSGHASRLEWAQAILELDPAANEQVVGQIRPASSSDFPTPARRPLYSALNCERFQNTFGLCLPEWRTALELAMETG